MTITEIPQNTSRNEVLGILRANFRKRNTLKVGSTVVDYCPYEGLRYGDDDEIFIAAADAEVESIHKSAQRAYDALFGNTDEEEKRKGTVAVRTSAFAASAVDQMLVSQHYPTDQMRGSEGFSPGLVDAMKVTVSRKVGGYVHVPLAHKEEALEVISLALEIAGETLLMTEEWEADYDDCVKEVDDLEALYAKVEDL